MNEHDQTKRDQIARDIFLRAVEMDKGETQNAYVEGACQGDDSLRERVFDLLKNHHKDSFMESPNLTDFDTVPWESESDEEPGTIVGRY